MRYLERMRRDHPLARVKGYVLLHRAVLYDVIGPGPHPCHWCGTPVDWVAPKYPSHDLPTLTTDHVDANTHNNRPENLVPACIKCNAGRGKKLPDDCVYLVNACGIRLRAASRTCRFCGGIFLATLTDIRRYQTRYCSRSCAKKADHRKWAGQETPTHPHYKKSHT